MEKRRVYVSYDRTGIGKIWDERPNYDAACDAWYGGPNEEFIGDEWFNHEIRKDRTHGTLLVFELVEQTTGVVEPEAGLLATTVEATVLLVDDISYQALKKNIDPVTKEFVSYTAVTSDGTIAYITAADYPEVFENTTLETFADDYPIAGEDYYGEIK